MISETLFKYLENNPEIVLVKSILKITPVLRTLSLCKRPASGAT